MNFCILEGRQVDKFTKTKYVEAETINTKSISDFRNSLIKLDLISKLDNNPYANPNTNYNVLSEYITS